jgi:hypothetical protein
VSSRAELRRLSAEQGEPLRVDAGALVGRWIYCHGLLSPALAKAYCQAQRGGRVLELQATARCTGAPFLVALSALRVVHVETVEEEAAARGVDPRSEDERRMEHLAQLYRAGLLVGFVGRLPLPHVEGDFRRVLDVAAAPPPD